MLFAGQKNDLRATSGSGQSSPESQNHGTIRNWEVALSLFPQPARLTELAITYAAAGQSAHALCSAEPSRTGRDTSLLIGLPLRIYF